MKGTRHLTIVIKIGSSSIVDEKTHQPILSILSLIVETAIKLRRDGHRVVIVSSGAIAVGLQRMNIPKKPKHLPQIQVSTILSINSPVLWWLNILLIISIAAPCFVKCKFRAFTFFHESVASPSLRFNSSKAGGFLEVSRN